MQLSGIVTLLTDFGTRDAWAGIMKGVLAGIAPDVRTIDLTHEIPPQSVRTGALALLSAVSYFPQGTIHVAVVDPGVGSERHALLVVTESAYLIGPDNGLLAPAAEKLGIRQIRRLDRPRYFLHPVSATFHGRDVFAPVAAHLANGEPVEALGSAAEEMKPLELPRALVTTDAIYGEVVGIDRFGNLVTNVPAVELGRADSRDIAVVVAPQHSGSAEPAAPVRIALVDAYAAVEVGQALAIVGSADLLEVSIRDGDAAAGLGATLGDSVTVLLRR